MTSFLLKTESTTSTLTLTNFTLILTTNMAFHRMKSPLLTACFKVLCGNGCLPVSVSLGLPMSGAQSVDGGPDRSLIDECRSAWLDDGFRNYLCASLIQGVFELMRMMKRGGTLAEKSAAETRTCSHASQAHDSRA